MTYETDPEITAKYKVLRKLPESGSSQVLVTEHKLTHDKHILKILNVPTTERSAFDQLREEFNVLRSLDHPGVARAYTADQASDGTPFLVMEYVPGKSVRELMNEQTPLSIDLGLKIIQEVLETMIYLDEQGVMHRDIKPEHIILDERRDRARLVDFGVSRNRTSSGSTFVGTVPYIAPEIWQGGNWARNSDLYSAGMVFYEMLTDHKPYNGDAITERNGSPTPRHPSEYNPEIPRKVGDSIITALASAPEDRFESAADWLEAIRVPLAAARNAQAQEEKAQEMDEKRHQAILEALEARMKTEPDNDLFDEMLQVQFALKSWDGAGEIPGAEQLQTWGIDTSAAIPSPAPASGSEAALSSADDAHQIVEAIRRQMRSAVGEDDQLVKDLQEARQAVQEWQDDGMTEPLPYADELAAWGVWPPGPQATASAPERDRLEPTEPPSDVDPALREEYEAAEKLCRSAEEDESLYYQAVQRLESLSDRARDASSAFQQDVSTLLSQAKVALEKATNLAIARAKRTAKSDPDKLNRQAQVWRSVVNVNPQSMAAIEALADIEAEIEQRRQSEVLDRILRQAERAATEDNLDLPTLNKLRGEIEAWVDRGERDELSPDIQRKVNTLHATVLGIDGLLTKVRDELGKASTIFGLGEYKPAYAMAKRYLDVAPVAIDREGILGTQDKEVSSQELHDAVRERYLTYLKERIHDRLEQVEVEQIRSPEGALDHLGEVQEWLEDTVLTPEDKRILREEAELVDESREHVERLLEKYTQAGELITQARTAKPDEALDLLARARTIYENYPGLDHEYEKARQNRGAAFAGKVGAAIAEAKSAASKDRFTQARKTLNDIRDRALEILPQPAPGSPLAQALDSVQQTLEDIQEEETSYETMQAILKDVEAALGRYEESKASQELTVARESLEGVPRDRKQHAELIAVRAKLASIQGDDENWKEGRRAYDQQDWDAALGYFRKIGDDFARKKEEVGQLAARARAAQEISDAEEDERERRWEDAVQHYRAAAERFDGWDHDSGQPRALARWDTDILTQPIAEKCHVALQRLAPLAENDRRVREILDEAETLLRGAQRRLEAIEETGGELVNRLDPIHQFPRAVELLENLQREESGAGQAGLSDSGLMTTLSKEITTELARAREAWRGAYVKVLEMARASNDLGAMEKALDRGDELEQANLLYDPQDKEIYAELACAYYDLQYARLMAQSAKDWQAIHENRQKRLQVAGVQHPDSVQEQLAQAQRKHIDQAMMRIYEEGGPEAARDYLGSQMDASDAIRFNPELVQRLIELCWDAHDWEGAESGARRLSDETVRDGEVQAEVWLELTRMAQAFADDQIEIGQARIPALCAEYLLYEDLIRDKERQCLRVTLTRLLREGRGLIASRPLQAAGKYARALKIAEQNRLPTETREARTALARIGRDFGPVVKERCTQAVELRVKHGDLTAAISQAEKLRSELRPIHEVAEPLQLGTELAAVMANALGQLETNLESWHNVDEQLRAAERELADGLAVPLPILDYDTGGWDFEEARECLTTALQKAGRDRELVGLVKADASKLEACEKDANALLELIRPLMAAVRDEDFDTVVLKSQELGQQWRRVQDRDPGWWGIETVLHYRYGFVDREARKPRDHQEIAEQQKRNLAVWERHAEQVNTAYDDLEEVGADLDGSLDELKQRVSLSQIVETCTEWLNCSRRFLKLAKTDMPASQSEKAEMARLSMAASRRIAEIEGHHGSQARISELKTAAQERLREFEKRAEGAPLLELQKFVGSVKRLPHVTTRHVERAKEKLQACQEVDPWHEKVLEYKKRIEELESRPAEGPSRRSEGLWPWSRG